MKFNRAGLATWPLVALIAALFLAATSAWQPALEFRPGAFATGTLEVATETPTDTETPLATDTEAPPSATPEEPTDTQPPPPPSPTDTLVPPTIPPPPTDTQPPPPSPAATTTFTLPPPSATGGRPPATRTPSATATRSPTASLTITRTRTATRTVTLTNTSTPTPPPAAAAPATVATASQPAGGSRLPGLVAVACVVAALAGLAVLGGLAWLSSRRQPEVVTAGQTYPISTVTTAEDCNCTLTSVKFEEEEKEEKGKKTKQKKIKIKYNPAYKPPGVKGDADQIEFETKLLIEVATKGTGKVAYKITPAISLFLYKLTWEELQELRKLRYKSPRTDAEERRFRDLNKKIDIGLIDLKKSAPGEPLSGDLDCPFEGTIEQEIKGDIWWEGADYRIGTKDKPQVRSFMLYIRADVECGKDSKWTDTYWTAQVGWEKGQVKISNEQIT